MAEHSNAILARGERACQALDNPSCLRIHVVNGTINEIREFVWDLYTVSAFRS